MKKNRKNEQDRVKALDFRTKAKERAWNEVKMADVLFLCSAFSWSKTSPAMTNELDP